MKPLRSFLFLGRAFAVAATLAFISCKDDEVTQVHDRDGDGVADAQDQCPDTPGSPEFNGCQPPPPDRDHDGIPDSEDECPDTPGVRQYNGCPPPPPPWWKTDECSGSSPYSYTGVKWTNLNPGFYYSSSLPSGWRSWVDFAAATWNEVGSHLRIGKYTTIVSAGVANDGKNVVSYGALPSGTLGTTYWWYNTSTHAIVDADIKLNSGAALIIGAAPGKYDVVSVLVHEFGHFCGLDHVNDRTHSMYFSLHDDSIIYRTLCSGDKLGLLRLY